MWFGGAVLLLGVVVATLFRRPDPFHDAGDTILRWFADHEDTTTVNIAKALNALTAVAVVMSARVAIVGILALYKRWRHVVVALATFVVSDFLVSVLLSVDRRPPSVPPLVSVSGYHFPSRAVASLAITLFAAAAALVPTGRQRFLARCATAVLVALVIVAQLALAADYPVDAVYAGLLAFALAVGRVPPGGSRRFVPRDLGAWRNRRASRPHGRSRRCGQARRPRSTRDHRS